MLKLNTLAPSEGARKNKKRVGRGPGSGSGKTAARGHKGARSRTGYSAKPGFEGGQMPLHRRLPKRGFNNKRFAVQYIEINVGDLDRFDEGMTLDAQSMKQSGLITLPKVNDGIKILGNGELTKKLHVRANAFTASAKDKIEKAGGTAEEV